MPICCSALSANLAIRLIEDQARRGNQWVRAWINEAHCRQWPSCSLAQRWEKKPENKEVEKPLLLITLPYNALHTPLWYKERQLQQKLTLSPGNQTTKGSERWEIALKPDICLYSASLLQPSILLVGVTFKTHSFQKIARIQCNKI